MSYDRADSDMKVQVRYQRDTDGGASPTAVLVLRAAGLALSARAVRELPLAEVMSAEMGRALLPWIGGGLLVEPLHDGPARLRPEHHERVLAVLRALPEPPPTVGVLAEMRARWASMFGETVPDSTMRRWIAAATEHNRAGRERLAADRAEQQRAMGLLDG